MYRHYREARRRVRKRCRRKGVTIDRQALHVPSGPNEIWSTDFVMDVLANGRRIKCLTVVGDLRHLRRLRRERVLKAIGNSEVCRGRSAPTKP